MQGQSTISAFLTTLYISHLERQPELLAITTSLLRPKVISVSVDYDKDFVVEIIGAGDKHSALIINMTTTLVTVGVCHCYDFLVRLLEQT